MRKQAGIERTAFHVSAGAATMSLPSPGTWVTFTCCHGDGINSSWQLCSDKTSARSSAALHCYRCGVLFPILQTHFTAKLTFWNECTWAQAKEPGHTHTYVLAVRWTSITSSWLKPLRCVFTNSVKLTYMATARLNFHVTSMVKAPRHHTLLGSKPVTSRERLSPLKGALQTTFEAFQTIKQGRRGSGEGCWGGRAYLKRTLSIHSK